MLFFSPFFYRIFCSSTIFFFFIPIYNTHSLTLSFLLNFICVVTLSCARARTHTKRTRIVWRSIKYMYNKAFCLHYYLATLNFFLFRYFSISKKEKKIASIDVCAMCVRCCLFLELFTYNLLLLCRVCLCVYVLGQMISISTKNKFGLICVIYIFTIWSSRLCRCA